MSVTRDTIGTLSLDDFVTAVAGIYTDKDVKRSVWDVWLHTAHHAASIGEEVRKYKPGKKLYNEIADFSMWLFTFAGKIRGPIGSQVDYQSDTEATIRTELAFSDIIWNKYPKVCPLCFIRCTTKADTTPNIEHTRPCECLIHPVETRKQGMTSEEKENAERQAVAELRMHAAQHLAKKPRSVDEWQEMFAEVFEANLRHLSLTSIAFHLLEEIGEVPDAMVRMYSYIKRDFKTGVPTWRQYNLESELGDVCSWLFTLVNYLQMIPDIITEYEVFLHGREISQKDQMKLSSIIWGRYGSNQLEKLYCPHCKASEKCACEIVLVPYETDLATLRSYATQVLE